MTTNESDPSHNVYDDTTKVPLGIMVKDDTIKVTLVNGT